MHTPKMNAEIKPVDTCINPKIRDDKIIAIINGNLLLNLFRIMPLKMNSSENGVNKTTSINVIKYAKVTPAVSSISYPGYKLKSGSNVSV